MNILARARARPQPRASSDIPRDQALAPSAIQHALRLSIVEGALSNIHISVTTSAFLTGFALLLGAGWVGSVLEDASFAWGLLFAAVLLGASAAADLAEGWSVGRWERRNGRILSSLLLVPDRVFYVDRGAQTA